MSVLTPQQKKGEAQTRPSPSVSEFVKPSARHAVDDPVYDRHRQRAVIALVDGDVAGLLVRHDMLVEVAVKSAAFGIRDCGEECGGVGGGAGRYALPARPRSVFVDRCGGGGGG